jgi:hypothetical protein
MLHEIANGVLPGRDMVAGIFGAAKKVGVKLV